MESVSHAEQLAALASTFVLGLSKIPAANAVNVVNNFLKKYHEGGDILKMGLKIMADSAMTAIKSGDKGMEKGLAFIDLCNGLVSDANIVSLNLDKPISEMRDGFINDLTKYSNELKNSLKTKRSKAKVRR